MNFKEWLIEASFDDMFKADPRYDQDHGKALKAQRKFEPYTIELYRGFDASLESLEKRGEDYVLSPKKSEHGMLWFTHQFIRGYDPKAYVAGRGEWLLKYPLKAKKHYDDGNIAKARVEYLKCAQLLEHLAQLSPPQKRSEFLNRSQKFRNIAEGLQEGTVKVYTNGIMPSQHQKVKESVMGLVVHVRCL